MNRKLTVSLCFCVGQFRLCEVSLRLGSRVCVCFFLLRRTSMSVTFSLPLLQFWPSVLVQVRLNAASLESQSAERQQARPEKKGLEACHL